jgi:hypothetical protein
MNSATITVTDITQTPRNLSDLLQNGSGKGYTVVPSSGIFKPLTIINAVAYLSIQASYTNGGTIVYKGDEDVKTDGSRQAKELHAGDTDVQQAYSYSVYLGEVYLTASANGAIINVEVHYA